MNNSNQLKYSLANITNLSIQKSKDDFSIYKRASHACERFLRSASLLPDEEFLGWQIDTKTFSNVVFSSPASKVTTADYDWIFDQCAIASPLNTDWIEDLYEKDRKVYMLSPVPSNTCDDYSYRQRTDYILVDDDDYDSDRISRDIIYDMFEMMAEAGVVMRMTARSIKDKAKGHGKIMLSIPDEMSLRMRSMLSIIFSRMIVVEVTKLEEQKDEIDSISDACFLENLTNILSALICPKDNKDCTDCTDDMQSDHDIEKQDDNISWNDQKNNSDNVEFDPDTPIDDLNFSIRSYNCLKRAGINTVGDIISLSDEDLIHIRNIGRKGVEEIKQKLADIPNLPKTILQQKTNYMAMLDELIGLTDIKEQIRKITAFAKMKQEMSDSGKGNLPIALNMEFVGNPGTAKTTVARILAGVFYETGILSSKEMIEVGRADLVAEYVGQTAIKVKNVFQKARGKVLFIDEAYSLVENGKSDFGDEAINTIVQEMENNRERTIVIFAGYPEKMESFFSRNPGLRSRVPFSINFSDYSAEDMVKIVELEAKKREFSISKDGLEKIRDICSEAVLHSDMGNGRFCRNLIEHSILGYASRIYGNDNEDANKNYILTSEDFAFLSCFKNTKKHPIGFHMECHDKK